MINPFLTNLAQTGWLDHGLVLFVFVCCCGPRWKNLANIQPSWPITYNGNWTEWSVINWSEIMRLISKVNEPAVQVRFKITSIISDQNCMTASSLTTVISLILPAIWFFYFKQDLKSVWLCCFSVYWLGKSVYWLGKRGDLEQKMMWFGEKSHCWEPIR